MQHPTTRLMFWKTLIDRFKLSRLKPVALIPKGKITNLKRNWKILVGIF